MMKEQFLKLFKNQRELQRNSSGDIRRERFLFRAMVHFFRKNKAEKNKQKKDETKRRRNTEGSFTERDEKRQ